MNDVAQCDTVTFSTNGKQERVGGSDIFNQPASARPQIMWQFYFKYFFLVGCKGNGDIKPN